MTRKQLVTIIVAVLLLSAVLAAGAFRFDEPELRRTYLLSLVVLYTMTLTIGVLAVVLVRIYPHSEGLVERYRRGEQEPVEVPEEVTSLIAAVRRGRRSAAGFEESLLPVLTSLAGERPAKRRGLPPGTSVMERSATGAVRRARRARRARKAGDLGAADEPPPTRVVQRITPGPSAAKLKRMLDTIEET